MDSPILKKYNVSFYKNDKGRKFTDGKNVVSSYLAIFRTISDIDDFLIDVDLCLSNNFDRVHDPDYSDGTLELYGTLTVNKLIISDREQINCTVIPLVEFKELLLSWREFLLK